MAFAANWEDSQTEIPFLGWWKGRRGVDLKELGDEIICLLRVISDLMLKLPGT